MDSSMANETKEFLEKFKQKTNAVISLFRKMDFALFVCGHAGWVLI
jgi:hypothetical protein